MGALFILLGVILMAPEVMSMFGLLMPGLTPASFLLASYVPPWGVHAIAIGGGLGAIGLGVVLMRAMLRRRYYAEERLIDGYGQSEEWNG